MAAAKVSIDFAKTNEKLVILGGAIGQTNLNPDGVKALAALPSLDELRGKLVGMIQTPATRIAQVVAAPGGAARPGDRGVCQQERGGVGRSQGSTRFES